GLDDRDRRLRIDDRADQQGGGDAVDMDPPSRRPGPTGEMAGPSSLGGAPSARRFESPQQLLSSLPSGSAEEVDSDDFLEPLARPGDAGRKILCGARAAALPDGFCQRVIFRIALGAELLDERAVRPGLEEMSFANVRLTTSGDGLLSDPLKVFEALLSLGERIDGVLERDSPDARQPLPNLGPQ